jgi:hypothetical protein
MALDREDDRATYPHNEKLHTNDIETCLLCGAVIERFDAEIFVITGRCAPCHEVLENN